MEEKGRGVEDYGRQIRAVLAFAVFGGVSCAMKPLPLTIVFAWTMLL